MRAEKEKREIHCNKQKERIDNYWKGKQKDEYRGNTVELPLERNIPLINENRNIDSNNLTKEYKELEDYKVTLIDSMWLKWKKYKKDEFNFKYKSEVSENAAKKELLTLCRGEPELAIRIIEQSIANGWKGLFNIKSNGENRKNTGADENELARLVANKLGTDAR